jgi:flagellar hook assembly protein FlgD
MKVFDAAGRLVATLLSSEQPAGAHELTWDGRGVNGDRLSAGVYFCRLEAGKETVTRKLLLLR